MCPPAKNWRNGPRLVKTPDLGRLDPPEQDFSKAATILSLHGPASNRVLPSRKSCDA